MKKPLVAIVGRPNVGKSTLFNKLTGKRIAIVEDTPGVTRDRITADADWLQHHFTLIDTGGIEPVSKDGLLAQMRRQAELAVETAEVIVFVVDGREGVVPADYEIADMLRQSKKPTILAVNKLDTAAMDEAIYEFYALGLGNPFPISAGQKLGLGELLDEVVSHFDGVASEEEEQSLRLAVVGKPNVGKSSLVNALLGEQRSIVSDMAGTTRDAIDTPFRYHNRDYTLVDTAGIRRKRSIEDESIERYSVVRSLASIRRCDVCLIVVDATEGLSEQDVKIAGYCDEEGKAAVLLINKWDLVDKDTYTIQKFEKKVESDLAFMSYVPRLYVSALTGQRVHKIMEWVDEVDGQTNRRIPTGTLNDILNEAVMANDPPSDKGRRLRLYYATQVSVKPPTFVLFVNDPQLMHFSYKRYIENYFRKSFALSGTPIRLYLRNHKSEQKNEKR